MSAQPPSYQSIEPPYGGVLAPAETGNRQKARKPSSEKLPDFLGSVATRIHVDNYAEELRRARKWLRNHEGYNGNHYGVWNSDIGAYRIIDPNIDDCLTVTNLYGYFIRTIVKEAIRSNAILEVSPTETTFETIGGARVSDHLLKSWFRRRWQADQIEREVKFACLTGNFYRRIRWAKNAGVMVKVPQLGEIPVTDAFSMHACPVCGFALPSDDVMGSGLPVRVDHMGQPTASCPVCGYDLEQHSLPPLTTTGVIGEQSVDGGDPIPEVVDPIEMKMHLHARRDVDSAYLRRRRLVEEEVVNFYYPNWDGPGASADGNLILFYQRALEAGAANSGYLFGTQGASSKLAVMEETWLQPPMYAQYTLPADFETQSGQVLEGGRDLLEYFPEGLCFVRAGNQLLDIYPEDFREGWVHGVYDVVPTRVYGNGCDDALQLNYQVNEVNNLAFEIFMHFATPTDVINPMKVHKEDVTGNPRQALIRLKNATNDDNIAAYFQRLPGGAPPAALFEFIQMKLQDMQSIFGSFPALSGDSAGSAGDPATRTAILRDMAVSMLAPYLSRKGQADVRMAQIVLKKYQQHWTGKRLLKGDYDDFEGQYFESADIQGDYEITMRPGSFAPRSSAEMRADFNEAGSWGNLPAGLFNPEVPEHVRKLGLQKLGIEYDADPMSAAFRKQRLMIKALSDNYPKVEQEFAGQGLPFEQMLEMPMGANPETSEPILFKQVFAGQVMPVSVLVDDHDVAIETTRQYLKTDRGLREPKGVQTVLEQNIKDHLTAKTQLAQIMAASQVMAEAPMQDAQQTQGEADNQRQIQRDTAHEQAKQGGSASSKSNPPSTQSQTKKLPTTKAGSQPAGSQPNAR